MTLTSHTATMDLMIQFPGDGMIPREHFGPISQFFMGAASKQRAEQLVAHGQVVQKFQHVNQDRNRYREQNQRLKRTHHLE